ncbi:hypothetical protein PACTADRAFT_5253 [Pachysolen tannophilus NRRL Y-2460]|uniref:Uncharacterized protein n=1 Tax=Pachysolen tannophilus NRRL Y-2460 TaxID=669874 RepID=A0A1E4TP31_PACTA|nr:hypothetical protein PACTADRAFT_5253 [Pachysolen tannophilus NRRL Y-2460]
MSSNLSHPPPIDPSFITATTTAAAAAAANTQQQHDGYNHHHPHQQQQQQQQQQAVAVAAAKPFSSTWTRDKELFLCEKVSNYMPDILTKSKTPKWKDVLDEFNATFNLSNYKIKQTRTMRDKFFRLYNKFLAEDNGKTITDYNDIELILNGIKLKELEEKNKLEKADLISNERKRKLDELEDNLNNTQQVVRKLQASLHNRTASDDNIIQEDEIEDESQSEINNEDRNNSNNNYFSSNYTTVEVKLPTEINQLTRRINRVEKDVDSIKLQLGKLIALLNTNENNGN